MRIIHILSKFFHSADEKQVGSFGMEKFLERMEDSIKCFFTIGNRNSYNAWKRLQEVNKEIEWKEREKGRIALAEEKEEAEKYLKLQREFLSFRAKW